jgi:hypothetical protein
MNSSQSMALLFLERIYNFWHVMRHRLSTDFKYFRTNSAFSNRYVKKKDVRNTGNFDIFEVHILIRSSLNLFPLLTSIFCTLDPPCNPKIKKMWTCASSS